ncbi:hypothetical protein CMK14_00705 [Candidatus Poribacteria bacterium]|nr:hypothetical protein [Candidatus Poribacteria bacterium]
MRQRTDDSEALAHHPAVTEVRYPGLSGDHAHKTAKDLLAGFGGLVDFVIAGDQEVIRYFQKPRRIMQTRVSLGDASTLVYYPKSRAAQSHP